MIQQLKSFFYRQSITKSKQENDIDVELQQIKDMIKSKYKRRYNNLIKMVNDEITDEFEKVVTSKHPGSYVEHKIIIDKDNYSYKANWQVMLKMGEN